LRRILLILFSFALWILLTWNFNLQNMAAGGFVAILTGLIFGKHFVDDPVKFIQPNRWFWALIYIPKFLWEMTKANFDVAYRVILSVLIPPKMTGTIEPGIVKVKTKLKSDMGKAFLANSITLTPGTFTIDLKDEFLYIHCIKVRHTDIQKATEDIVSRFEPLLIKIFD